MITVTSVFGLASYNPGASGADSSGYVESVLDALLWNPARSSATTETVVGAPCTLTVANSPAVPLRVTCIKQPLPTAVPSISVNGSTASFSFTHSGTYVLRFDLGAQYFTLAVSVAARGVE